MEHKRHIKYVRLTDRQLRALELLMEREDRTVCDTLRQCVKREAQRQGLWEEAL